MTRRPLRILITGSRSWTDQRAIAHAISDYLHSLGTSIEEAWPFPIVVHGAARGADQLADTAARNWGWTPEPHPGRLGALRPLRRLPTQRRHGRPGG
jgi:hypothetical protein